MATTKICRYCGESFELLPGKPGYADECPKCLHEKTAPPKSTEARVSELTELLKNPKEAKKGMLAIKRQMMQWGNNEEAVDKVILSFLEMFFGLHKADSSDKIEEKRK